MLGDSAPSVLVLTVRWVLINVLEFFLFVFLFSLCKKKRDSAYVCVWVLINVLEFFCLCFFSLSVRKRGIQPVFVFGF